MDLIWGHLLRKEAGLIYQLDPSTITRKAGKKIDPFREKKDEFGNLNQSFAFGMSPFFAALLTFQS